ncbi:MAG TPA: AI-2E family transporter [Burkholderiales bacterium]|nr:AI-2E family transporter [Burkholderiales bacterium]
MLSEHDVSLVPRRVILALLLGALFIMGYLVLGWFIAPAVWAAILAYVTWPAYERLRRLMRGYAMGSALVMTLLLTTAFVLPLLWLIFLLQREFVLAYQAASAYMAEGPHRLPEFFLNLPWIGERLQDSLDQFSADPTALRAQLAIWVQQWQGQLGDLVGGVGRNAVRLGFALLTVVFVYRDGDSLLDQVRRVLRRFLGARVDGYIVAIGNTTKAVLYGLVLTALAQGLLSGLGYWAAGVRAPVLFGAFTALVALMPFGTPFVWGALGLWLLFTGNTLAGVGLLLWGGLVVSSVDNLIRPLVISSATQIPFLLVMFGVIGGLAAFGLIGMFVGPVVVAVLLALWREWLEERAPAAPDAPPAS